MVGMTRQMTYQPESDETIELTELFDRLGTEKEQTSRMVLVKSH